MTPQQQQPIFQHLEVVHKGGESLSPYSPFSLFPFEKSVLICRRDIFSETADSGALLERERERKKGERRKLLLFLPPR